MTDFEDQARAALAAKDDTQRQGWPPLRSTRNGVTQSSGL